MRYAAGILTVIVILIVAGLIFVYSGWYNFAATVPHWHITFEAIQTAVDRSVAHYSQSVVLPSQKDGTLMDIGFRHYHAMCRLCHGAPGYEREEFAQGMYPKPPDLATSDIEKAPDKEVFWVVSNGLKMSGMPAFSPTHPPNEILGMVRFAKTLPQMKPQDYKRLVSAAGGESGVEESHEKEEHGGAGPMKMK